MGPRNTVMTCVHPNVKQERRCFFLQSWLFGVLDIVLGWSFGCKWRIARFYIKAVGRSDFLVYCKILY